MRKIFLTLFSIICLSGVLKADIYKSLNAQHKNYQSNNDDDYTMNGNQVDPEKDTGTRYNSGETDEYDTNELQTEFDYVTVSDQIDKTDETYFAEDAVISTTPMVQLSTTELQQDLTSAESTSTRTTTKSTSTRTITKSTSISTITTTLKKQTSSNKIQSNPGTPNKCKIPANLYHPPDNCNPRWISRFYYDTETGVCKHFWNHNCPREDAKYVFKSIESCNMHCVGENAIGVFDEQESELTRAKDKLLGKCSKVDSSAIKTGSECSDIAYYYDPDETYKYQRCKILSDDWCSNDPKSLTNKNVFKTETECYLNCEENMECSFYHSNKQCFGVYKESKWTRFFTFDPVSENCVGSWYGNCSTLNAFQTMDACQKKCGKNT